MNKITLKNKFSIVTGGAGYIGKKVCETLCDLGSDILILDNNKTELNKISRSLKNKYKCKVDTFHVDLTEISDVNNIYNFIRKNYQHIDVLVNAVAMVGTSDLKGWNEPFSKQSRSSWDKAMDINLSSLFFFIQKIKPAFKKNNKSSIINISSIYGSEAPKLEMYKGTDINNPAAYSISKAGLNYMTKWLAVNLAPNIRVNSISPGGIIRGQSKKFIKQYSEKTLLNRMASEEDIIGSIIFLSTSMSSYVTGQNIIVDGGWSIK
jgi:NAD(P)-dependent dehydrogenase (short-subunit alcohol dehydrogenase family)